MTHVRVIPTVWINPRSLFPVSPVRTAPPSGPARQVSEMSTGIDRRPSGEVQDLLCEGEINSFEDIPIN
jgi:hypothetical protein